MGTGIVAHAAATLPFRVPGLHIFALAIWALAAAWLVALAAGWGVPARENTERAKAHACNPVMAQFWGAPAMALLTVGTGDSLLLWPGDWMGLTVAVYADWVLGPRTASGRSTACWIPYLMMTRHVIKADDVSAAG